MFKELGSATTDFVIKNAPTILTAVGAAGVVLTAVSAGKASIKAKEKLEEMPEDTETIDKVKEVAPILAPSFLLGAATIFCIFAANHEHLKREGALAAAYTMSSTALQEYESKVVETIGKKKEKDIRDSIAEDKVNKCPPDKDLLENEDSDKIICFDTWTSRYFKIAPEGVDKAINTVNSILNSEGFACLNDWYNALGLEGVKNGEDLGWKLNEDGLLELEPYRNTSCVLYKDKYPVRVLTFVADPKTYFDYYY